MVLSLITVPARSPAQPPDFPGSTLSGGWAGERAGAAAEREFA